jgi:hypothetical protein
VITREQVITHILEMKLGKHNTPPQPEYAQYITGRYAARLPEMSIAEGVSDASRRSIFVDSNPYKAKQ